MRIKKHPNRNQYLRTPYGMWVRDFTKIGVPPIDINETIGEAEYFTMLKNEVMNQHQKMVWVDHENFYHQNVVIVSDGYDFQRLHQIVAAQPSQKVTILGVNKSLVKWAVPGRNMNYYVVNNPFQECLEYLPRRNAFPRCITSMRTNSEFVQLYRGLKYRYAPATNVGYSGMSDRESGFKIDDYRNPICAAIGIAYQFRASRILLLCCDDAFQDERPGSEQLPNGLWIYPQQRIAHSLIDANLYWLSQSSGKDIELLYHGRGPQFENATYIQEEKLARLFEG